MYCLSGLCIVCRGFVQPVGALYSLSGLCIIPSCVPTPIYPTPPGVCLTIFVICCQYLSIFVQPQKTSQSPDRLYKAPTDYTKPRQTTQSPDRLHKAPTDSTKPPKYYRNFQNIRPNLKILNKSNNKY